MHEQRMHKNWYDEQQVGNIVNLKAPWTEEEAALLARHEARLTIRRVRFINQELAPYFPNRSLEAIKGQRRYAKHKESVLEFIRELAEPSTPPQDPVAEHEHQCDETGSMIDKIKGALMGLEPLEGTDFHVEHLSRICNNIGQWSEQEIVEELEVYLQMVFPSPPEKRRQDFTSASGKVPTKRKQRRAEYARTQRAWRRNPCDCLRAMLKDKVAANTPNQDAMVSYWRAVMTNENRTSPGVGERRPMIEALWNPISEDEVKKAFPENTTAPGPDGVTARLLKAVPLCILVRIFNILLICGRLPERLLGSRTTLIPKKDDATEPGDFRPITVSSVIVRTFHKILASRLAKQVVLDQRQRAFIPADGCAENIWKFDIVLRHHRQNFKPLYLASVDIAKAFDSVTHETIMDTLVTMGVPGPMVAYIKYVYQKSRTMIACDGWASNDIHPACGVKQGDPLSPMLFNMVMDRLLQLIPKEVGVDIAGEHYNAFAFADDLVLMASTPQGLQLTLDKATGYLAQCGLVINTGKSFTVAIRNVPHVKKSVVDHKTKFTCCGNVLPSMQREDEWRYLGVPFSPEGRVLVKPEVELKEALLKLTRAPLKPQQRLFGVRVMVLPSLYHILTLGGTNLSRLKKVDTLVRGAVRKWIALPHDTVNAYFHANVRDGGLSIPSMRWLMPLRRKERLEALVKKGLAPGPYISQEISRTERRLKEGRENIDSRVKMEKRWADLLHASSDGKALKGSREVPHQHQWVTDGNHFLSGRDFVNSAKLRINALPTKSRSNRGRIADRLCRAGCNEVGTLNHILQRCHRTHAARVARHNAVVAYLKRALQKKAETVDEEPHFQTPEGLRKPDLVAKVDETALVIDAQVVGEQVDRETAHQKKVSYYSGLRSQIIERYDVTNVMFTSATLSCRGLWGKSSAEDLVKMKILKRKEWKVLSSRALIGGINAYRIFNQSTSVRRRIPPRAGIG